MTTIEAMADHGHSHTAEAAPTTDAETPQATAAQPKPGAANRSLLVPVLTTLVGALVTGVFLLAVAGFNVLRSDINRMRDDLSQMRGEIEQVRNDTGAEIGSLREEVSRGFEAVNEVLLDHTDRLARMETHLGINGAAARSSATNP